VGLYLYVQDVDSVFDQAVQAGAKPNMKPADMFWGDRYAQVTDPWGHIWSIATHTKDVNESEMKKGAEEFFAQAARK
jgi:PhnB protein